MTVAGFVAIPCPCCGKPLVAGLDTSDGTVVFDGATLLQTCACNLEVEADMGFHVWESLYSSAPLLPGYQAPSGA